MLLYIYRWSIRRSFAWPNAHKIYCLDDMFIQFDCMTKRFSRDFFFARAKLHISHNLGQEELAATQGKIKFSRIKENKLSQTLIWASFWNKPVDGLKKW